MTGVVRHNHTIIEKEVRYVRRDPGPDHRRIRHAQLPRRGAAGHRITVPVTLYRPNGCYRGRDYVGYGSCRPSLRVRG